MSPSHGLLRREGFLFSGDGIRIDHMHAGGRELPGSGFTFTVFLPAFLLLLPAFILPHFGG
jgi:hypothetical protein